MIYHLQLLAEVERQRLAGMIATSDEFRRAKQAHTRRKPRWRLRGPGAHDPDPAHTQ